MKRQPPQEHLIKPPPQVTDIEEVILGALLLESPAYETVKDMLLPEYFYSEAHQLIYSAIASLYAEGRPHADIRIVKTELSRAGTLEKVGGAYKLAELTSKVSSAANLQEHTLILVEHYVKRELIQIGSRLHTVSYDDSTDALHTLTEAVNTLTALNERIYRKSGPQQIRHKWETTLLLTAPDDPPPILHIDGIPMAWPGGHTLIVGKKKSRKTLFIVLLITWYLKESGSTGDDVLIFDTEQSRRHVYAIRDKIHRLTGRHVPVFYLRGMSPEDRQTFIRDTVAYWPTPPQLIVNDGIRDMMNDINDPKESTRVVTWLEQLTLSQRAGQRHLPHVLNVLHLNKGDSNPRGHIGTELQNKADCTVELVLDASNNVTDVKCESSRERPFNPIAFIHDDSGLPQIVTNAGGQVIPEDDRKNRLHMIFEDGPMKRNRLIEAIKAHFGLGTNRADRLLQEFRRLGWIIKSGADHSPDTVYKLMISDNGHPTEPIQTSLNLKPQLQQPNDDLPF